MTEAATNPTPTSTHSGPRQPPVPFSDFANLPANPQFLCSDFANLSANPQFLCSDFANPIAHTPKAQYSKNLDFFSKRGFKRGLMNFKRTSS
jgi:hypothetical protein